MCRATRLFRLTKRCETDRGVVHFSHGPRVASCCGHQQKVPTGNQVIPSSRRLPLSPIRVDGKNKVLVNGKSVASRRSDGAVVFKSGFIPYTIQGDPRLKNENSWFDSDAQTTGPIRRQ